MTDFQRDALSKVPAVTVVFWIIKIIATTLGETAGDAVTMTWLGETTAEAGASGVSGYLIGTGIFGVVLIALILVQVRAKAFHPLLYWATIVASTTAGTTMADFATRSLGIGYTGGSALLLLCVLASLFMWYRALGTISVASVHEPRAELYYWITITFSQTLGTALGDWTADTGGLGYIGAAAIFAAMLAVLVVLYYTTKVSRIALFWAAFILTRPLGAALGDFLDKPIAKGGLDFSRPIASIVLGSSMLLLILLLPQRPEARVAQ